MIDPRRTAVLIRRTDGRFEDKTADIAELRPSDTTVGVIFSSRRYFEYGRRRVLVVENPQRVPMEHLSEVLVDGRLWSTVTEAYYFAGQDQAWWHLFYGADSRFAARSAERVQIVPNGAHSPGPARVLAYWSAMAALLPEGGRALRQAYGSSFFVHPDSALHRYLNADPIGTVESPSTPPLYPFHTNLSQREAIANALKHPISVIDGPPGTGKTQTILNLIASIVVDESKTVAVVSSNNSAVDNVDAKLREAGFGYITANLGRASKKITFFAEQHERNRIVDRLRATPEQPLPSAEEMAGLDGTLRGLRETERELAQLQSEHAAYELERRHFLGYVERHEALDPRYVPVLRWKSEKILAFLAATDPELARTGGITQLIERIGNYFRFRSLRAVDAQDVDVVLRLQQLYYDTRISELEQRIAAIRNSLDKAAFGSLAEEQRAKSEVWLTEHLRRRYFERPTRGYGDRYRSEWAEFSRDYPVVLSTCHSLESSIGKGRLVDYLVIDEASQVDLLAAGVAMACCRTLIVVGDIRQLRPIVDIPATPDQPPAPAYDYRRHSILSSLIELYGDALPRVMLREHYRCDPSIIGFCDQKFYDDELIPFTRTTPGYQAMVLARTAPGNHMRRFDNGDRINQREIDVIEHELLPRYCAEFAPDRIGITTPYRRQADRVTDALIDAIESDTVHSFQGREKDAIVMTTVLDETTGGRSGLAFADAPELVNVAVSRAKKRFVLVTNHALLPTSRNLRDLIGYIRYHNTDDEYLDSTVVSVFDLLYRDYSHRLRPLAARLRGDQPPTSEDIMRAVLHDVLREAPFQGIRFREQVLLKNLLPDTTRLDPSQRTFVQRRSSVDFDLYNHVTKQRLCVIEVDGFAFHENDPEQTARDQLKNAVCAAYGIPLLRFPTTGSEEVDRLRRELTALLRVRP